MCMGGEMAVTADGLKALSIPEKTFVYGDREVMLYALGIGYGDDPLNRDELPFVFEGALKVMPTLATVIAWDDDWAERSGLNLFKVVHGEQRIRLHRPLPPAATIVSRVRITDVFDKGADKGCVLYVETALSDKASGETLATLLSTVFARGDGGFGGPQGTGPAPHPLPERAPDLVRARKTTPNQALIYRLSGDRNPLHADPGFAAKGGFDRPILHGLCTYGHACAAVVNGLLDFDPTRVASFEARFSAPVFPGETIATEMWRDGEVISFRSKVVERDVVVLNNGKCVLRG